jgi:hypothetical protein
MKKAFSLLVLGLVLTLAAFVTSCKNSAEDAAIRQAASCTDNTKNCCQAKRTACEKDCDEENHDADSRRICKYSCRSEYYDCIEKAHD